MRAVAAIAVVLAASPALHVVRSFQRYSGEEGLAVGFGSVWTGSADGGDSIARTDIATGKARTIHAPIDEDDALFVGDGALWQTDFGHGIVRRIDPATNHVTARGGFAGPADLVFAGRRVFVGLHHGQALAELDPQSLKEVRRYALPRAPVGEVANGPSSLAAGGGALWVSVPNLDRTLRVDVATGRVTTAVAHACDSLVVVGRTLWAGCGKLVRIDLATRRATTTSAPGGGRLAASLRGTLWLAANDTLIGVDEATGSVTTRQRFKGAFFTELVAAQGRLWGFDANRVRVDELAAS